MCCEGRLEKENSTGRTSNSGNFGCPRCNCRIVYDLWNADVPMARLEVNPAGHYYAEPISSKGRIMKDHYRCVDCHFEFDDPIWISAECYEGK